MSIVDSADLTILEAEAARFAKPALTTQTKAAKMYVLGGGFKRALDILIAALGLIILSPLILLVSASLKLTSTGPVLYGHTRIGFGGKTFRCWKFRSMVTNGDAVLAHHFKEFPGDLLEWQRNRKLRDDPRVTWIGHILRTYSVDELPQLLNVLSGEMSLVGPRPVVQDELELYGTSARLYLSTRPGITGLWQISGRSNVGYAHRVSLDTEYVNNWSLWQDLKIIMKTIPAVLKAQGSY